MNKRIIGALASTVEAYRHTPLPRHVEGQDRTKIWELKLNGVVQNEHDDH